MHFFLRAEMHLRAFAEHLVKPSAAGLLGAQSEKQARVVRKPMGCDSLLSQQSWWGDARFEIVRPLLRHLSVIIQRACALQAVL